MQRPEDYATIDGILVYSDFTYGFMDKETKLYTGERRKIIKHSGVIKELPQRIKSGGPIECCMRDKDGKFLCERKV